MQKKTSTSKAVRTKTTINKTAALLAADANTTTEVKKSSAPVKSKPPVVEDIDEANPERK